ncbi:uncharacterized protein DMENIID0001_110550 [Sergentomyia squamirostris]
MFSGISSTTPSHETFRGDDTINLTTDLDFWSNVIEENLLNSPLAFDASEGGLWNGKFVPPPPRPPFLEETVSSDGLTTCDLCSWAWRERNAFSLDGPINESSGDLGWALTLITVSLLSALIGAIVMVIFFRCRRLKAANAAGGRQLQWWCRAPRQNVATNRSMMAKHTADSVRGSHSNSGLWTWLSTRRVSVGPDQLTQTQSSPAENHYTHMNDAYSPVEVDEALYAELDRESVQSGQPSYQNTAYSGCGEADQEVPMVSSAPSSAYYSDLSVTAMPPERTYEVVGLTVISAPLPNWEPNDNHGNEGFSQGKRPSRLAAINESSTVPSEYV